MVVIFHSLHNAFNFDQLKWSGWLRDFNAPLSFLILSPFSLGYLGVAVFFVVSGFCVHLSHQKSSRHDWPVYFVRRFFRIYPPYFVAVGLLGIRALLNPASIRNFAAQFPSHVLMAHNFDISTFFGINVAFWSIAVEVQLYVLYPLLLLLVRRIGWGGALMIAALIEIGLRATVGAFGLFNDDPLPRLQLLSGPFYYWLSWSIGAKLADDHLNGRPLFSSGWPGWLAPVLMVVSWLFKPLNEFTFLFAALATANGIAFLLSHPGFNLPSPRLLRERLQWAGVISYSVYLLHEPLLNLVPRVLGAAFPNHPLPPFAVFVCCLCEFPLIGVVCWLFYRFVEQTSIATGKWIVRNKMTPAPAAQIVPRES